jgi:poly-gamma-glutamate synthesis protein (capsule biosynthesis protein)
MASPPQIASELKWAGFDMLAHANNHAFDYGASGVLETIQHVESEGLVLAGSGADLQQARSPKYLHCRGSTVALIAMASDFVKYGKASHSRSDMAGRPGINPLATGPRQTKIRPFKALKRLANLAPRWFGGVVARFPAVEVALEWDRHPDPADLNPNLEAISDAASKADIVVASIHAHRQGPWLEKVARQAIDRGSHVVLIHGPHEVRGVELYRGRPIFYALGDFVFETQYITRLPAEAYQRAGLPHDASPEALKDADVSELQKNREAFEALVAVLDFAHGGLSRLRLLPIDLNFNSKDSSRGRPQLASSDVAKRIVERAASRSARFGTKIRYDPDENVGVVVLG